MSMSSYYSQNEANIRVLYVLDGLPGGGAERQLIELLKGLKEIKNISTILCPLSSGGTREEEAVQYSDHLLKLPNASNAGFSLLVKFPFIIRRLVAEVREQRPDIIHTFGCFADIAGCALSKMYNIPFINGSIRAARPKLNFRDRISRLTFSSATAIVANSRAGLRSFNLEGKGIVIHNGVDLIRFENVAPTSIDGSPVLCMIGNFTDKKDQATLIKCMPALIDQYKNIRLVLVGKGKNATSCKELSLALSCGDKVLFLENCDNPEPYIAASDLCFLFTNTKIHGEGISNAIIDYMALGKPVIASDCGGNDEIIEDGKTGFLVPENDSLRVIDIIKQLLDDKNWSNEIGRRSRFKISQSFTVEKMVSAYVKLYGEISGTLEKE